MNLEDKPVAAQEPEGCVINTFSSRVCSKGTKSCIVVHAAPCARCKDLDRAQGPNADKWMRRYEEVLDQNNDLKAKITEQAALISELEARETILVRSNSSLNIQRAENDSLKEVISLSEDSRLMDEYLKLERANARQAERIKEQAAEIERLKQYENNSERYMWHVKLWAKEHGMPEEDVIAELDAAIIEAKKGIVV